MKKSLTVEDIVKIMEEKLPEIIERSPFIRLKIEEIMEKKAVTREEIKEILMELRAQREDTNKRLVELREDTNRRFEEINKRFEELREDTNKRFEELREDTNRRFEEINKRFEELREDTNRRFEEINKRFEELREDTNRRFELLTKEMRDGFKVLKDTITAVGARWGIFAEEAFRESMEGILKELGFYDVKKWEDYDKEGFIFGYPSTIEVDLVIRDDKHYLIEVKSSVSDGDVLKLKRVGEFYEKRTGVKPELVIVSPYIKEEAKERCKVFGIKFYRRD
ncbi:MAG: DUF3782 domain-containing protein [candidate division WOR-3 bacterium]